MDSAPRRPGDLLLDRYLPDADEEMREQARREFRAWAHFLIRIGDRLAAEGQDSPNTDRRRTIEGAPDGASSNHSHRV